MAKVGNYVQRDYHGRFKSQRKSTWSDYNKGWGARRSKAIQAGQNLRAQINTSVIGTNVELVQQQTVNAMQNRYSPQATYANPTAVSARVNMII